MIFSQNKAKLPLDTFAKWAIMIIAFILILGVFKQFIGKAEGKTAETICRGSVAARIYAKIEQKQLGFEKKLSPLLCKTLNKELPESTPAKGKELETVKREISNSIARCWWMFGEGTTKDTFGSDIFPRLADKCFICYTIKIKDMDKGFFKGVDLRAFMASQPYKIIEEDDSCHLGDGFCYNTKQECEDAKQDYKGYFKFDKNSKQCQKKNKKGCCYTNYDCINKGGICKSSNPNKENYVEYNKWSCPRKLNCFIKKDSYQTYLDYIQLNGKFYVDDNLLFKEKKETYAVVFISDTSNLNGVNFIGQLPWIGQKEDLNRVLITRLGVGQKNSPSDLCYVQLGTGGQ
jgi:hypothetical protein